MPKILSVKQLMKKHYKILDEAPEWFRDSFGELVGNFKMVVWGESGNGKSSFLMQFIQVLAKYGVTLYISLEEGHEKTMQTKAEEYFSEEQYYGKIRFADHTMTYEELDKMLARRKSPKFIVIDSLQYWGITNEQYKVMKAKHPTKSFIFISHANGKMPDGKVANQIKYDAGLKLFVEGYIVFVKTSRYGGKKKPFVIWEEGARNYWGKEYTEKSRGIKPKKKPKADKPKPQEQEPELVTTENTEEDV